MSEKSPNAKFYFFIAATVFLLFCVIPSLACLWPILNSSLCCRQDRKFIDARYTDFYESIDSENYQAAYRFMSPQYRQNHSVEEFTEDFYFVCDGICRTLASTRSLDIYDDTAILYPGRFSLLNKGGPEFELVKIDGEWYFTGNYEWYIDGFTTRNTQWPH